MITIIVLMYMSAMWGCWCGLRSKGETGYVRFLGSLMWPSLIVGLWVDANVPEFAEVKQEKGR